MRGLGACALMLWALGCARAPEADLLELSSVSPDRIEPGREVRIEGRGFPVAREAMVRFEGERRTPGGRSVAVVHRVAARTGTDGALRVPAERSLFDAMGGRATFHGTVQVAFRQASGEGWVSGRLTGVTLDFLPATRERLALDVQRRERGEGVALRLGITFAEEEQSEGGLTVAAVAPGGPAAMLGLEAGDRLTAMDGLRLYSIGDLVPPPGIVATRVEVMKSDQDVLRSVALPLTVATDLPTPRQIAWAGVLAVLLWVLTFIAPTARLTATLSRRLPPSEEGNLAWLFGRVGAPKRRRDRALAAVWIGGGVIAMSSAFAGVAVAGRTLENDFGVGILLSASLALRLTSRIMSDAPLRLDVRLLPFFVVGAPLAISVICVCVLLGTGHLVDIHRAQGGLPWQWLVVRHPVVFVLFPVFAATALGRVEPAGGNTRLSAVAARGHLIVVSCLGAALFLGGWNPPMITLPYAAETGVLAFVAKCWALIALGLWARRMSPEGGPGAWRWAVPGALVGLASATAWVVLDVPVQVEALSGPLLTALVTSVAVYVLYRRVGGMPERVRLYPFL